jgi:hypothetical protein
VKRKKLLGNFLPNFDLKNMISIDTGELHGMNGPNWPDLKEKNSKSPDILMINSHKYPRI